jgi:hypothetical protein
MKSNKIFYISNLVFNLPDDFQGTVTDALELVVQHRRSEEAARARTSRHSDGADSLEDAIQILFNNEDCKLHIETGMSFYDEDKNDWIVPTRDNPELCK